MHLLNLQLLSQSLNIFYEIWRSVVAKFSFWYWFTATSLIKCNNFIKVRVKELLEGMTSESFLGKCHLFFLPDSHLPGLPYLLLDHHARRLWAILCYFHCIRNRLSESRLPAIIQIRSKRWEGKEYGGRSEVYTQVAGSLPRLSSPSYLQTILSRAL